MPIAPLDLQQLYMQQAHIGRMEHARMAAKTILMQSEDKDIHRDSYVKDSTVVKTENTPNENIIKERKESQRQKDQSYMSYRKKLRPKDDDNENVVPVVEEVTVREISKGKRIDILG